MDIEGYALCAFDKSASDIAPEAGQPIVRSYRGTQGGFNEPFRVRVWLRGLLLALGVEYDECGLGDCADAPGVEAEVSECFECGFE